MSAAAKRLGKSVLCRLLEKQVRNLRSKHKFSVIAVVGSVGKTSTKLAIVKTLSTSQSVISQEGNYNDRLTVPLVLFDHSLPGLFNVPAWIKILLANRRIIAGDYPYKYAVLELGTDSPGQIAKFAYLKPEIVVVTAVTPEHMEYFKTIEAVAREELTVFDYAEQVLINGDDVPKEFLAGRKYKTYSLDSSGDYVAKNIKQSDLNSSTFTIDIPGKKAIEVMSSAIGKQGVKIALAAAAVADMLGLKESDIVKGLNGIKPFAGRMQILPGILSSTIIDDTYNASPVAVKAGLDVLYKAPAKARIAILGSMNELGNFSPEAHREVGNYLEPKKLDLVVTIGKEAKEFLAPAAKDVGCKVESFLSPYEAGDYVASQITDKQTVILAEGSQNGVFAEEALKPLLKDLSDRDKLVRQSAYWLSIKRRQFSK